MNDDPFIGSGEAASLLDIRPETLAAWAQKGTLNDLIRVRVMPNGRRRYSKIDIEKYLEENTHDRV